MNSPLPTIMLCDISVLIIVMASTKHKKKTQIENQFWCKTASEKFKKLHRSNWENNQFCLIILWSFECPEVEFIVGN